MTSTSIDILSDLFPTPSSPPSEFIPKKLPGATPESVAVLREILSDNHTRWDIFFNDKGFHNHSAHRALALFALGAPGSILREGYRRDRPIQRSSRSAPGDITDANWKDHTGDHIYCQAYLEFFTKKILGQGVSTVLEEYVFSNDANTSTNEGGHNPAMLDRLLGGLVHSLIHTGYGLEFGLPGMIAEGLAQAAVHSDSSRARVIEVLMTGTNGSGGRSSATGKQPIHAFTAMSRVLEDPELQRMAQKQLNNNIFSTAMIRYADKLADYTRDWFVDEKDVNKKIEELSWLNVIIYGVGGWGKGDYFNADFFTMHLVTSSLFLPSFCVYLSPVSQILLLRSYLHVSLGYLISRGMPNIDIEAFYEGATASPTHIDPAKFPQPSPDALVPEEESSSSATISNPWLPIIENAVIHPHDHFPKLQRALIHYDMLYGCREAGQADFGQTGLPGAERLDGTLFIRVAGLTAERMGRVREGENSKGDFDRVGFYKDQKYISNE